MILASTYTNVHPVTCQQNKSLKFWQLRRQTFFCIALIKTNILDKGEKNENSHVRFLRS